MVGDRYHTGVIDADVIVDPGAGIDGGIGAVPAVELVIASAAGETVGAQVAIQTVVVGGPSQRIVAAAAAQHVG